MDRWPTFVSSDVQIPFPLVDSLIQGGRKDCEAVQHLFGPDLATQILPIPLSCSHRDVVGWGLTSSKKISIQGFNCQGGGSGD